MAGNELAKSLCLSCKSELNPAATKCSACGSFQDWRRHVESGQLLLGFILVVITFLAVQPVKDMLLGTSPSIHATILTADTEHVWVIASNDGNGAAALVSIRITANTRGGGAWQTVLSLDAIEDRLLKPGEIKIISLAHHHEIPEVAPPGVVDADAREACNLSVEYFELHGYHVIVGDVFKCYLAKKQ